MRRLLDRSSPGSTGRRPMGAAVLPLLAALALSSLLVLSPLPVLADDGFLHGEKSDGSGPSEPDDGLKAFDEVVSGLERTDGFFPIYRDRDRGKLYLEIPQEQLGQEFLLAITRSGGDGDLFDNAAMLDSYVCLFRREGKKVQLYRPNPSFVAPGDSAFARAIERGVSGSVVIALDLAARPHPERKSLLVDPSPFLLQDNGWVASSLRDHPSGYRLDGGSSYVDRIQSFPKNLEIDAVLTFRTDIPKAPMSNVVDSRSFSHRYHYSLVETPPAGYAPRLADDRVGHFLTMLQDYSNTRSETPYVRYVDRWRLEKKDPAAALSEPVQPIVYWIENTVPVEYRDAVRRGILNWNRSFEAAGFKNAIVVEQMPDTATWDPADLRYHVVRWMLQPGASYAVGPSRTDPRTGKILDADIRVSADIARVVYREWTDQVAPISMGPGVDRAGFETLERVYAEGMANQASFGLGLAGARGLFDPDSPEGRRYLDAYIEGLVCHELGHTLGLRHNFKSSTVNDLQQLQDPDRTRRVGITGSIMDYTPVNLASAGQTQGEYWQTGPGAYDDWAIEYAYRPFGASTPDAEWDELQAIASRASEPELAYGTDEDARGYSSIGIDPTVSLFDLGSDPIAWAGVRLDLANELWGKMDSYLSKDGMRYVRYRQVFSQGLGEYTIAAMIASKHVGGVYHHRDHIGDPGGRIPFQPVPASKQREALDFLATRIFSESSFRIPPELLNKIAPERFPTFEGQLWYTQRIDPPIHGMVLALQQGPLARLFDPVTLSRIQDSELRFAPGEEPFRMIELFRELRKAIWSEADQGRPVSSFRRNLQRAHLNHLVQLVISPEPGTPEDATTLARADLKAIRAACERGAGNAGLDSMTRAHLDETRDRIGSILEAPVVRSAPDPRAGPRT
ncbi:MAG: zinc-dependent metalloprotease [Candidatus Eisenbacteria bacterium]|nr:zinc-dependent metalloprotease [Candidatus Eisenbacteria bacterium]